MIVIMMPAKAAASCEELQNKHRNTHRKRKRSGDRDTDKDRDKVHSYRYRQGGYGGLTQVLGNGYSKAKSRIDKQMAKQQAEAQRLGDNSSSLSSLYSPHSPLWLLLPFIPFLFPGSPLLPLVLLFFFWLLCQFSQSVGHECHVHRVAVAVCVCVLVGD